MIATGDCMDAMAYMPDGLVDAIVTDPPYGLGFMGRRWDDLPPGLEWAREALRIVKPGAYVLAFGGTRTYHRLACALEDAGFEIRDQIAWLYGEGFPKSHNLRGDLEGWGTALKPAHEPIVIARKRLAGTVKANVEAYGTGALHVGACKIGDDARINEAGELGAHGIYGRMERVADGKPTKGRWPANVVMDEDAAAVLEGQAAGASRFVYVAKASRAERDAGLEGFEAVPAGVKNTSGRGYSERDPYRVVRRRNPHPTVKPIALMRWLVRLVTPPDGLVLDPFAGTGTTGIAAGLEGFRFAGVEREPEYVEIATARLAYWATVPRAVEVADALAALAERERIRAMGQMELTT